MSVDSLAELLVIKPSYVEGKEGVVVVPELIFQADFPSGAGYLLSEDAVVFGKNLTERWRMGGGSRIWTHGAVRHEGSHYFMAHLSPEAQDELMERMSTPKNLELLRSFYSIMRGVASEYSAEYFSPNGPITRSYTKIAKEVGRGYHHIREMEFEYQGNTERVNLNLVVDELLAFFSLVHGSSVRIEGVVDLRISGKASELFEKTDQDTKNYLENLGFTNLDIWILWSRIEFYLNNPDRLHEITKPIVIKTDEVLH